jgi:LysM repeat protein
MLREDKITGAHRLEGKREGRSGDDERLGRHDRVGPFNRVGLTNRLGYPNRVGRWDGTLFAPDSCVPSSFMLGYLWIFKGFRGIFGGKMRKTMQIGYLLAMGFFLAGCTISYSNPPTGSPKTDGTSAYSTNSGPVATMNALRTAFIQQTAQARGESGTPAGATNTASFSTVAVTPTVETTSGAQNTPATAPTATQAVTPPSAPTSTPGVPKTYKIHEGETYYCLGRRFDIDPADILAANNNDPDVYPDDVIAIPQSGDPFPGERALHPHTANMAYTVTADYDTIYKIGCYFGDVDPNRIITANSLKDPFTLTLGQKIVIP